MATPDHYGVLGIEPDADERAVKRAYRKAARACHPDLPENKGSASAARRFQEIRAAYDVLSDPKKRAHYDRWGRGGVSAAGGDWHASWHSGPSATEPGADADDIELDTQAGSGVADIFSKLFGDDPDVGSSKGGGGTPMDNPWERTGDGGGRAATGTTSPPKDLWNPELMNQEGRASAGDGISDRPASWGPAPKVGGVRTHSGGGRASRPASPSSGASGAAASTVTNSDPEGVEEASPWRPSIRRSGEAEDGASRTGIGGLDYDGLVQAAFGGDGGAVGEPPQAPSRAEIDAARYGTRKRARRSTTPPPQPAPTEPAPGSEARFEDAFGSAGPDREPRERRGPREAPAPSSALRMTVSVPFLTALHGGTREVTFRVPDADGNWAMERVSVSVPPAIGAGTTVTVAGRGHHGADGRGDLVLDLVAEEHPYFRVEGCNVVLDVPITPYEAVGGVRLEVPTVHGVTNVSIPPGIRAGERIVLRGLGLPDPEQPGRKGTQILVVLIQLPPRLSGDQIDLLAKLEESSGFKPRAGIWD